MQRMMVFKSGHARLLYKPLKIDQDQAFGELNGGSGHRGAAQTSFLPGVSLQALPYGGQTCDKTFIVFRSYSTGFLGLFADRPLGTSNSSHAR